MEQKTAKTPQAAPHEIRVRPTIVPNQEFKYAREAYVTASLFRMELAGIGETLMNKAEIRKAVNEGYLLAVAHTDLPETKGWHRIFCGTKLEIRPILLLEDVKKLREAGRWEDLLFVSQSAIHAARYGKPLTLSYWENGHLEVNGASDFLAKVVLVNNAQPVQNNGKIGFQIPINLSRAEFDSIFRTAKSELEKLRYITKIGRTSGLTELLRTLEIKG